MFNILFSLLLTCISAISAFGAEPSVALVENYYALKAKPKNSKVSRQIYSSIKLALEAQQVKYFQISDRDVERGALKGAKVAIFPYNGAMSDSEIEEIHSFIKSGGKIVSCYEIPPKLRQLHGLEEFKWLNAQGHRVNISRIRFLPEISNLGFPELISEKPDHIFVVKADANAKTIAYWESLDQKNSGYPAAVFSKSGVYVSSVIKGHDYIKVGRLIAQLLQTEPLVTYDPKPQEELTLKGIWVSIWIKRDWQKIMKELNEYGFNTAFVQMNSGGSAYYPSQFLPPAQGRSKGADDLKECISWAKHYGIQVHAWRTSWVMHNTPDSFFWKMHAEGRLQKRYDGLSTAADPNVKINWLCPSNEENRNLEVESLLEMVRNYDIDGIHLDYMRFPNQNYCFDDNCKVRFQKEMGISVKNWPYDVLSGGRYQPEWIQWRKDLITSLVERISSEARRLKPYLKVSLAARPVINWAERYEAQDYVFWARRGYLDFICPMNYTPSLNKLRERLLPQLRAIDGNVPVYPGIGAYMLKSPTQIAAQIEMSQSLGAKGFVLFAYDESLVRWMPKLRSILLKE